MGQMALGLLYGTFTPTLHLEDDNAAQVRAVLERFHAAAGLARWRPRVVQTYARPALVGIWVALGGSGAPGIAFLVEHAVPLEALPAYYADALADAQRVWGQFVAYCVSQEQVEMSAARLWLTPTEVA